MLGHLKIMAIKLLSEKPMSGYAIIKRIESMSGCWKPSAGSVYPMLAELKKTGLVSVKLDRRQKIYSLTKAGKKYHSQNERRKQQMVASLKANLDIYQSMSSDEGKAMMMGFLEEVHGPKIAQRYFKGMVPEVLALKKEIWGLYISGRMKKRKKEIGSILTSTIKELRKL